MLLARVLNACLFHISADRHALQLSEAVSPQVNERESPVGYFNFHPFRTALARVATRAFFVFSFHPFRPAPSHTHPQ